MRYFDSAEAAASQGPSSAGLVGALTHRSDEP